ncbi:MAG: binary toxin-like calcium binding domain-containing protein, partial [Cyclonatronaceae bacterium]
MKTEHEAFRNTSSSLIPDNLNGNILAVLLIVIAMTCLHSTGANAQEQLLRDYKIQLPERPESVPDLIFHARADGTGISLQSDVDSDSDGIPNWLEIEGYTFSPGTGALETCTDEELSACFRTDPLRWSTDGDPYSDFMEATGVNMPAGVRSPFRHPLVAARPVINVRLASYDVTPIETITDVTGGEQSSSFTNTTSNQTDMDFDIGLGLAKEFVNPAKLLSGDIGFSYSNTTTTTESSTSSSSMNWSTSRSRQPNEAAELRLNLFMTNSGHATARNVRPTFNLVLAGKTIATIKISAENAANSLTEANTQNSRYPLNGTIAIDRDSGGNKIILTMNELRAIQMGTPLSLVVTQVDADVVRWNPENNSFDSNIAWTSFENEIDAATVLFKVVRGTDIFTYNIYAGTEAFDPGHTLGDLLPVVMSLEESNGQIWLGGNVYPDSWYSFTDSQSFIDAWNTAGQPGSLLGLPAKTIGNMVLISPPVSSKPKVPVATYAPDMRDVLVIARSDAGLPVDSVWAEVTVNGQEQRLLLSRASNSAFYTYAPTFESEALFGGKVIVQDARGVQHIQNLSAGPLNGTCSDLKEFSGLLSNGSYLIYPDYDPEKPSEAWCQFMNAQSQLLETPLVSFWIPREPVADELLRGGTFMDEDRGVLVGRNGIWLTEDGGESWELRHNSRIPEGGIEPGFWYETWSQVVAMGGDTLLAVGSRDVYSDPVEL